MLSVSSIFHSKKMTSLVSQEQLKENILIYCILPQKARIERHGWRGGHRSNRAGKGKIFSR